MVAGDPRTVRGAMTREVLAKKDWQGGKSTSTIVMLDS
jgi:hypothetical protein